MSSYRNKIWGEFLLPFEVIEAVVKSYKYDNVKVDYTMKVSDHYPVYCDILIDSKA